MKEILVIEPDKKLANVYGDFLRENGFGVSWAAHAQDAVFSADQKTPDLIILELQLGMHNGVEFLYEFRSYPEWENIPVILLTLVRNDAVNLGAEETEKLGVVDHLYKPETNLEKILRAVRGALYP